MSALAFVASPPPSHASRDPYQQTWEAILRTDIQRYPQITRAALTTVMRKPVFLQAIFVSGAIGGSHARDMCTIAKVDPVGFNVAARKIVFPTLNDVAYSKSRGYTPAQVLSVYRRGIVFGCDFG